MENSSMRRTLPVLAALLLSAVIARAAPADYPLHGVVYQEDSVELTRLLRAGHDPNALNDIGQTPLISAASLDSVAAYGLVKTLLDFGADPDAVNDSGNSPLHGAVSTGNLAVVKLLLDRGADPNARKAGAEVTPLLTAYVQGRFGIVKALKEAGASAPEGSEPMLTFSGIYIREVRKLTARPKPSFMSDDEWTRMNERRAVWKVREALRKPGASATVPENAESVLALFDVYFQELEKLTAAPKPQGMSDDEWRRMNERKAMRRVREISGLKQ